MPISYSANYVPSGIPFRVFNVLPGLVEKNKRNKPIPAARIEAVKTAIFELSMVMAFPCKCEVGDKDGHCEANACQCARTSYYFWRGALR